MPQARRKYGKLPGAQVVAAYFLVGKADPAFTDVTTDVLVQTIAEAYVKSLQVGSCA